MKRFGFLFLATVFVFLPFAIEVNLDKPTTSQWYFFELSAFAGALAYGVARIFRRAASPPPDPLRFWILLYAASLAIAAWKSPVWQVAAMNTLFPLAAIAFYMLAFAFPWERGEMERLVTLMALFALISSAYGIAEGFGIEVLPYTMKQRIGKSQFISVFGNPNFAASYLGPILVLVSSLPLWRTSHARRPSPKIAFIVWLVLMVALVIARVKISTMAMLLAMGVGTVGVASWAAGVFIPFSALMIFLFLMLCAVRSVWLGLGIAFVATILFLGSIRNETVRKWGARAIVISAALVMIAVGIMPFFGINMRQRLMAQRPVYSRIYSFSIASDMIRQRPVFGWGYDGFQTQYYDFVFKRQSQPGSEIYNQFLIDNAGVPAGEVHNDLLEVAVDCGLVGVFALLGLAVAFVLLIAGTIRQSIDLRDSILLWFILAAFIVFAVDGLFSFPLRLPASGMLAWGLLGAGCRMCADGLFGHRQLANDEGMG